MKNCKIFVSFIICAILIFTTTLPLSADSACNHQYGNWSIMSEATCTEDGEEIKICSICDEMTIFITEKAYGHSYKNGKCTVCEAVLGDVNADGDINMLDVIKLIDVQLEGPAEYESLYDINSDGSVSSADIAALKKKLFLSF